MPPPLSVFGGNGHCYLGKHSFTFKIMGHTAHLPLPLV